MHEAPQSAQPWLTIVTVLKSGPDWLPEYVYRLQDAVQRHLRLPYRFVCISDQPLACETLPLQELPPHDTPASPVWYKLQMHRPEHGLTGRTLFLDLDTIIRDDFDDVILHCAGYPFLMGQCPFKGIPTSAIMYWEGDHSYIWHRFQGQPFQHWLDQYQNTPEARTRGMEQAFVCDSTDAGIIQWVGDSALRIDRVRKQANLGYAAILLCSGARKPWHMPHHPDVRKHWIRNKDIGKMIISTLLFNDEFDMLEIYLEITSAYCDRWIIAEADRTFSGLPKPYNLRENLDRFAKFRDRIDLMTLTTPEGLVDWQIDNWMRVSLQKEIDKHHDDTIFLHGDTDEVTDPRMVPEIIKLLDLYDKPVALGMHMFIYRFDQRTKRGWKGPVWARKRMFENPQLLIKNGYGKKKDRSHCTGLSNAGWHWTWMGDDDRIRNKIRSCIESQNRDVESTLEAFRRQDIGSAINQKCVTEYCEDPGYPADVMSVLSRYPYWTQHPSSGQTDV